MIPKKSFTRLVEWFLIHVYMARSLVDHLLLCTYFVSFSCQIFQTIRFKGVQLQWQQQKQIQFCMEKRPVEDNDTEIVGTGPEFNRIFSPIGRHILSARRSVILKLKYI